MSKTGDVIKQARLQRKLTQSQLAAKIARLVRCSYSRAALSQVENGDTKDMKPANLFATCKILGIDPQAAVAGKLKWVDAIGGDAADAQAFFSEALLPGAITEKEQALIGSYRRLTENQQNDILQHVQEMIADYSAEKP